VTARNITAGGHARVGVGATRDVVMIEADLEHAYPVPEAPEAISAGYAGQADWDPRKAPSYLYLVLRPTRIQAWRELNEIADRALMRDGAWLV
jgi:hypothetical protein